MVNPIHRPQATIETHKNRDRPPRDPREKRWKCVILPLVEISGADEMEDRHIDARQGNQRDFGDKKAIFQIFARMGNEQETAGGDGQAKSAHGNRQDRTHQTADGPIDGGEAEQPQIDHRDRSHDQTDRENVDRFTMNGNSRSFSRTSSASGPCSTKAIRSWSKASS